MVLFNINEITLVQWYKNTTQRVEIKQLMQGLSNTHIHNVNCLQDSFSPVKRPSTPPSCPLEPHSFPEPEDTTGQARVRKTSFPPSLSASAKSSASTDLPSSPTLSQLTIPSEIGPTPEPIVSRTTQWRRRKSGQTSETSRKVYTCRMCRKPMSTEGHTQFRGQRYCPNVPGQIPRDEWLAQKKLESKK